MNRFFTIIIALMCYGQLSAQQTYYYKLTKQVINGIISTNVSGGQFITFIGDICYESDIKGIGVGHGTMSMSSNANNIKTFKGGCYFGNQSAYRFSSDFSSLNVTTNNGDNYYFQKATPPSGVNTCSLIKNSHTSNTVSTPIPNPPRQQQPMQTWIQCNICLGDGKCHTINCTNGWNYGTRTYCLGCGGNGRCHFCNGNGGHYEVRYY